MTWVEDRIEQLKRLEEAGIIEIVSAHRPDYTDADAERDLKEIEDEDGTS